MGTFHFTVLLTFGLVALQIPDWALSAEERIEANGGADSKIVLADASSDDKNQEEPLDPLEELKDLPSPPESEPPEPEGGGSIRANQLSDDQILDLAHAAIVGKFGDQFVVTRMSQGGDSFLVVEEAPPAATADTSGLFPKSTIREPTSTDRLNRELRNPTPAAKSRWEGVKSGIERAVKDVPVEVKTREYEDSRETYRYDIIVKKDF